MTTVNRERNENMLPHATLKGEPTTVSNKNLVVKGHRTKPSDLTQTRSAIIPAACGITATRKKRGWLCQQLGLSSRNNDISSLSKEAVELMKVNHERKAYRDEDKFLHLYSSYEKGKDDILKLINDLIAKADGKAHAMKHDLYKKWEEQVFEYITRQVDQKVGAMTPEYISSKLRKFHYNYVKAVNTGILFMDVDNEAYAPSESLRFTVKYSTDGLCDPLKLQMTKERQEDLLVGKPVRLQPMPRETFDPRKWAYNSFRSSIHGHYSVDEEDGSEVLVQPKEKWHSHDVMWNFKFGSQECWNEEFPRGKYIVPNKGRLLEPTVKSFGKARVYGVACLEQPQLQLYYA